MVLITLTFKPFFILFILLIPVSENCELGIKCIWDYLKPEEWYSISEIWDFICSDWSADEEIEELSKEDHTLSKEEAKVEERLSKVEQILDRLKKCHIDEIPSKETDKCNIDNSHANSDVNSHACTERCLKPKPSSHYTKITENVNQKPACITSNFFTFKSETNINIIDKRSPISPYYMSINMTTFQFKFIFAVLVFLMLITGLSYLFYETIRTLENATASLDEQIVRVRQSAVNSTIESIVSQDEDVSCNANDSDVGLVSENGETAVSCNADDSRVGPVSRNSDMVVSSNADDSNVGPASENGDTAVISIADVSEEEFVTENKVTEETISGIAEWTAEKVYHHVKRIAEKAAKEYPRHKNVQYLSDEFLTQISNFIVRQGCFRHFEKYLTPKELLKNAGRHHRVLEIHGSREKDLNVGVIVNVDGVQIPDLESQLYPDSSNV